MSIIRNPFVIPFFHTIGALITIYLFGYIGIIPFMLLFASLIFLYYSYFYDVEIGLIFMIFYMMIFDSDLYSFGDLKIRLWYPIFLIYILSFIRNKNYYYFKNPIYTLLIILWIIFLSYYLIVDDFTTKLYILKYILFTILPILFFSISLKHKFKEYYKNFIKYLSMIVLISVMFAIVQFVINNLQGINNPWNNPLPNKEIRPNAFFSESTWSGEFSLLGIILLIIQNKNKESFLTWIFIIMCVLGAMISQSRNVYLCLVIIGLFLFINRLITSESNINIKSLVISFFFIGIVIFNIDFISDKISNVYERFIDTEDVQSGRLKSFKISLDLILQKPFLGYGFYWDKTFTTVEGNAYGSKSMNILLMIAYIFGLPFLILNLGYLFSKVIKFCIYCINKPIVLKSNYFDIHFYSVLVLIIFFVISLFAPLHQFPLGIIFVVSGVYLSSYKWEQIK